jgi:transcriptional regulator
MFVPNQFKFDNQNEQIAFMKQYSFATIITANENVPVATHLPFVIDDSTGNLVLSSHFAAVNIQTKYIEANTSLVIFTEPHAYISPVHYDKHESVPTWDYIAVHAYGKARILDDENAKINVLEQMIKSYDENYLQQWNSLSDKYRKGMLRGIVAFELVVTDLQGQKKLSQNKTEIERQRIAEHLAKGENTGEKDLAEYIRDTIETHDNL